MTTANYRKHDQTFLPLSVNGNNYYVPPSYNDVEMGDFYLWMQVLSSGGAGGSTGLYNVKSSTYGAVGDGIANDTAALQAAADAAVVAGHAVVYLPDGNYKITKPIYAGATRVAIRGDSRRGTRITASGFVGPGVHLGLTQEVIQAAPAFGTAGYSLNFTQGATYKFIDLRETKQLENFNGAARFIIEGYWKTTETDNAYFIYAGGSLMEGDTVDNAFDMSLTSGFVRARANIGGVFKSIQTVSTMSINTWHHVCMSYDGTTFRVFLDGVLEASTAASGTVTMQKWENITIGQTFAGFMNTEAVQRGPCGYIDCMSFTTHAYRNANFTPSTTRAGIEGGELSVNGDDILGPMVKLYSPYISGGVYVPVQTSDLDNTSRMELSSLSIAGSTTGVSVVGVNDATIEDIEVISATVGAVNLSNNCFFSFISDLDLSTTSTSRYGMALTSATGVVAIKNVKMSAPHMGLSVIDSGQVTVDNYFIQDCGDVMLLLKGEPALEYNFTLINCLLATENVPFTLRALVLASDAGIVNVIGGVYDTATQAVPVFEMSGVGSINCFGVSFAGSVSTEIVKVHASNPGSKKFNRWGGSNQSATPATTSTSLIMGGTSASGSPILSSQDKSATPGAATINHPMGKVAIASGAASVVVTNSLVTAASIVTPVLQFSDATLTRLERCVPGAGSFTIVGNANATLATKIGFTVSNPA